MVEINCDHALYLRLSEDAAWHGEWSEVTDADLDAENTKEVYYLDLDGLLRGLLCLYESDLEQISVILPLGIEDEEIGTILFEKE